jgi:hypothetical protein
LMLSTSSSLALFNYLFNGTARDFTMVLAMSLLFGVLVWLVFNGGRLDEIKQMFRKLPIAGEGGPAYGGYPPGGYPGYGAQVPPGYSTEPGGYGGAGYSPPPGHIPPDAPGRTAT